MSSVYVVIDRLSWPLRSVSRQVKDGFSSFCYWGILPKLASACRLFLKELSCEISE